jgi:hypothetical protein
VAILKALPALADKLTPAAEQDEAADKRKDEARGQTWMPSEWLRQLWQTPKEVEAQIERVQRADTDWEMSPAEMLGNAIQL